MSELAPDDPRHGTANGYMNLGCRCDECRRAKREWQYAYYHSSPERLEAHNAASRRWYKRRKEQGA